MRFWRILTLSLFFCGSAGVQASPQARVLFNPNGSRPIGGTPTNSMVEVALNLPNLCSGVSPASPALGCFTWNLISSDSSVNQATLKNAVEAATNYWKSASSTNLDFRFNAISSAFAFPYKTSGSPAAIQKDSNGNSILQGPFYFAFPRTAAEVPPEVSFGAGDISKTVFYVVPNLTTGVGNIQWGAVYFNPALKAGTDYDLNRTLVREVGSLFGLAPLALQTSVMYVNSDIKSIFTALADVDIRQASYLYPMAGFKAAHGIISGKVTRGTDASAVIGAEVEAIPLSKLSEFLVSPNARSLAVGAAISGRGGSFSIVGLNPDEYFLITQSVNSSLFNKSSFDEFISTFMNGGNFPNEFYDGKGRECNREADYGYSAQEAKFAATLKVSSGAEVKDVELITNITDSAIGSRCANGASDETLSAIVPTSVVTQVNDIMPTAAQANALGGDSGGCSLNANASNDFPTVELLILVALFISGAVLVRRAQVPPVLTARKRRSANRPL